MATVIDLYTKLAEMRGLDFGELRNVARGLQIVGLLPRASRRERMSPPQVTAQDCATFLIAIAVSRTSGARIPEKLSERVRLFKDLHTDIGGKRTTLFDHLAQTIERYLDRDWVVDKQREWQLRRFVFVVDEEAPEVWFEDANRFETNAAGGPIVRRDHFIADHPDPKDPEASTDEELFHIAACADAFIMNADIFFRLRRILLGIEAAPGERELADV